MTPDQDNPHIRTPLITTPQDSWTLDQIPGPECLIWSIFSPAPREEALLFLSSHYQSIEVTICSTTRPTLKETCKKSLAYSGNMPYS
jgi:hypothetical protein